MVRFQASVLLALLAAALWAQDKNHPGSSSSSSRPPVPAKSSLPEAGAISDGVYHNPSFGFSYKLHFGWVDRTREMQDDSADASKSLLLLAIFERPPEASGETVNSAVVIAAERLSTYSGMKTAADYFGPLTELATAKGFQVVNQPYDFSIGATHLVRGDFSKTRGALTLRQTALVMLEKGYAVSFTFIGGSEDEVNELVEKLSFGTNKPRTAIP
jgi:hypothetical protein